PRLERGSARDSVGHAGAALVEDDQPREGGKTPQDCAARCSPYELDVRDEAGHEDHVERTLANDLVCNRYVTRARVADFRLHAGIIRRNRFGGKEARRIRRSSGASCQYTVTALKHHPGPGSNERCESSAV